MKHKILLQHLIYACRICSYKNIISLFICNIFQVYMKQNVRFDLVKLLLNNYFSSQVLGRLRPTLTTTSNGLILLITKQSLKSIPGVLGDIVAAVARTSLQITPRQTMSSGCRSVRTWDHTASLELPLNFWTRGLPPEAVSVRLHPQSDFPISKREVRIKTKANEEYKDFLQENFDIHISFHRRHLYYCGIVLNYVHFSYILLHKSHVQFIPLLEIKYVINLSTPTQCLTIHPHY